MTSLNSKIFFLILIGINCLNKAQSTNGNGRYWLNTCQDDCELALKHAVHAKCNSQKQCFQMISKSYRECAQCANDIMDPIALETIKGKDYFLCQPENSLQLISCKYYCRSKHFIDGDCLFDTNINVRACFCINDDIPVSENKNTTTSTKTSTTTTIEQPMTTETIKPNTKTSRDSLVNTFNEQSGFTYSLVALPNGYLASGSWDNTIKIWNTQDGTIKQTLVGHKNHVLSLAVLSNGDLASGSADSSIIIWNLADGSIRKTLIGHDDGVTSLAVLPNGDLASASFDKTIKIWNLTNGTVKQTLIGHASSVFSLTVLSNSNLVSGSFDLTVKIWNTALSALKQLMPK